MPELSIVGRTPWSARVPLDPLAANEKGLWTVRESVTCKHAVAIMWRTHSCVQRSHSCEREIF
jgi:hypothetical protein